MDLESYLEQELIHFCLLEKAKDILLNLGSASAVSYIRASYHLLCKVYHPDNNMTSIKIATVEMKRLNALRQLIERLEDQELIDFLHSRMNLRTDSRTRILLVEDDAVLLDLFQRVLEVEGYCVYTATDGNHGLKIFQHVQPDLVLTDIVMPGLDGIQMVKQMRSIRPRLRVVFFSGYFDIEAIEKVVNEDLKLHSNRILAKPFKISELLQVVQSSLQAPVSSPFRKGIVLDHNAC